MQDIDTALDHIRAGGMVIVVDGEERENEGDLLIAADYADEAAIAFMAIHGRGLVCMAIEEDCAARLALGQMVGKNSEGMGTAFTVSVDARRGTSTGISPADRAMTVATILDSKSKPADLLRPGHLFPLVARPGGVLERPGHTEAAVDLARLAGFRPAGVICEIIDDDGKMARLPRLKQLAAQWKIPLISIKSLIEYRSAQQTERMDQPLLPVAVARMPLASGEFLIHAYPAGSDGAPEGFALVHNICEGGFSDHQKAPLVRIHSECLTGESLGSLRCDCGFQLQQALRQIQEEGCGVLVYLRQEGRGIGLMNKIRAYELQDKGFDTMDANIMLGHPGDARSYDRGVEILKSLGITRCRLLTNNPDKLSALSEAGIEVSERVAIEMQPDKYSRKYMQTKMQRFGHLYSSVQ